MHEAISRVWNAGFTSVADIQESMTSTIREYFEHSFLLISEKVSAQAELLEEIPIVARALETHFCMNKTAAVHTELWVEDQFRGTYQGSTVVIPIHGKLDAVIDTGPEVWVFDYKTKQAMSVAAIKGETASSDGGYFRQLIFYKMLVAHDSRWKMKRVTPALVFVSPDTKGACVTRTIPIEVIDIERVHTEIQALIDSVWSGNIARTYCSERSCEWCGIKKL